MPNQKRGIAFFLGSIGSALTSLFSPIQSAAASAAVSARAPKINMESVFYLSAYWQGVDLISGRLAGVTLDIMNGKGEVAKQHPVQKLLKEGTFEYYDRLDFIRVMVMHIKTAGQSFMLNDYDENGVIKELMFLNPISTRPFMKNGRLEYQVIVDSSNSKYVPVPADRVFHTKLMTMDGINGMSPIGACYPALQLALAANLYGLNYFANDARPSTVITSETPTSEKQATDIVREWTKVNGGVNNRGVTVLPHKFSVHTLNVPPDESQAIGARQESVRDVGRVLNIPSVLIGDMEASTYNNVREAYNALDNNTLVPMADKIVSSIDRQLLTPPYHARFDWENHFTAPQGERYSAYSQALAGKPFALISEIRKMEGLRELNDEEMEVLMKMGGWSDGENEGQDEEEGQEEQGQGEEDGDDE